MEGVLGTSLDLLAGSPWTPEDVLITLGAMQRANVQEVMDVQQNVDARLKELGDRTNEIGCLNKLDPLGNFYGIASVDSPLARELVIRHLPILLRTQRRDGSWNNGSTPLICGALRKYGLFERLRELPPLPPDWRVVDTIAAPEESLLTLDWNNGLFWSVAPEKQVVVAISPADGSVVKRLPVPSENLQGVGAYEGKLAVSSLANKGTLTLLDPDSGEVVGEHRVGLPWAGGGEGAGVMQVGEEVWIGHGCWVPVVEPETGSERRLEGYGPWPLDLARDGDTVWITDGMHSFLMYHWGLKEDIIEVVDAPFGKGGQGRQPVFGIIENESPVHGITHDGKDLWALDSKNHRICRMERAVSNHAGGE